MDFIFESIYENTTWLREEVIDLSSMRWCEPWPMGLICLKAMELKDNPERQLILPTSSKMLSYLKRMHFDAFMDGLGYGDDLKALKAIEINEQDNPNVHEIMHCIYRDEFNARLSSRIRRMFTNFGMSPEDEQRSTALVGELGNNVFDHNEGAWPRDVRGAIVMAQNYPTKKFIEVVVADPGIGFLGSLQVRDPNLADDVSAIQLGLSGVTGRVGESRGNGLRVVQDWTINKFNGIVKIHSGSGLVIVDEEGQRPNSVMPIVGTLASFLVRYK